VLFRFESKGLEEILRSIVKTTTRFLSTRGIPVPENVIDLILAKKKTEDVFEFLEEYLSNIAKNKRPILILDELQVIKDIKIDGMLIYKLFNLFVRLTKELHLCHVLCLTSDSIFVEYIYNEAMLQGRAKYILVDDFDYETTKDFLKKYGFSDEEIEFVWKYFGGKPVYLIDAIENKDNLKEFCEEMLKLKVGELKGLLKRLKELGDKIVVFDKEYDVKYENVVKILKMFEKTDSVKVEDFDEITKHYLIKNNILFMNPIDGLVKPQSKLDLLAIREVVKK
jgi:AAA+ ATPase superfamily predicted ATPase